ncbi:cyanamide hydratase [Sistotremastrum suecicum HHB10207 ss-3]|uniref:Cyanamide hydratase n=1 Tax=Sistotremastrum suecicum HHB10207 ss-3 TaxID=1314776 RepID=A0A165Y1N4_9AGAM|nr:cyanamide hydratase [Sistotremastrum suecicum HHB10207 ss-3]
MATDRFDVDDEIHGWRAVPRDPDVLFKDHPTASGPSPKQDPFQFDDIARPQSELARKTFEFAKSALDTPTFNHSNRCFTYGAALVKTHFPEWKFDEETYYLSCLLHDIGTADAYLTTTRMSFEFKGGIVARDFLIQNGAPEDQADAVCEAIIRHQDLPAGGNITQNGCVLQLSTLIDNLGSRAELLHDNLFQSTVSAFPRQGWSEAFAQVILKEDGIKPWCHTTVFEKPNWRKGDSSNFADGVRANTKTGARFE